MGTTLAIVGAYALAGELARADDVSAGFAAYERYMRPQVDEGQSHPEADEPAEPSRHPSSTAR